MKRVINDIVLGFLSILTGILILLGPLTYNLKTHDRLQHINQHQEEGINETIPKHSSILEKQSSSVTEQREYQREREKRDRRKDETRKIPTARNTRQITIENVLVTFYTANCKGCTGYTRWGEYDVRNTVYYDGMRIISTDPSVIPPYSIVEFELDGKHVKAIALDTGGAIKGKRIDFLVESEKEAIQLGKKYVNIKVVRKGK